LINFYVDVVTEEKDATQDKVEESKDFKSKSLENVNSNTLVRQMVGFLNIQKQESARRALTGLEFFHRLLCVEHLLMKGISKKGSNKSLLLLTIVEGSSIDKIISMGHKLGCTTLARFDPTCSDEPFVSNSVAIFSSLYKKGCNDGFDQIEPLQYLVNQPLNIQNEPDNHELFISKVIQLKLQNEYAQPFLTIAITFDLSTGEPEDSLRMGDEHLDTIPEIESDEFIKSSVENLVPNPSESEDLSNSECDVPACDDFTTFSNLLFDADDDFSSSDNELILFLMSSLVNSFFSCQFHWELIIDCDPEEEIRLIEKLLYDNSSPRPPKEFISKNFDAAIKSFSLFPIPVEDSDSLMEENDLSLTPDDSMPPDIEEYDYDSERDMLILEELLSNDSVSLPESESFHFDIPSSSRPPAKPPDDSGILTVKVVGDISEHNVPMPRLLPTQPTLV
nr:thyroid adenoma-associated protein homolog [Tanacetum cinerariifolium]